MNIYKVSSPLKHETTLNNTQVKIHINLERINLKLI